MAVERAEAVAAVEAEDRVAALTQAEADRGLPVAEAASTATKTDRRPTHGYDNDEKEALGLALTCCIASESRNVVVLR